MYSFLKTPIAVVLCLTGVGLARLAFADPPTDPGSERELFRKAKVSYETRCAGVTPNTPEAAWCVQERARLDAWAKKFGLRGEDDQGQDQQ